MNAELQQRFEANRVYGKAVCSRIGETIVKIGFPLQTKIDLPNYDTAEFSLVTDPYTQSRDLVGIWYDAGRQRIGQIKFHGDGSFYAEFDVVQPHPSKKRYFVEAVHAWGKPDAIKAEAKLIQIPQ